MGNCFLCKNSTDHIIASGVGSPRVIAYATAIFLPSEDYISCVSTGSDGFCVGQDYVVTYLQDFALKHSWNPSNGIVKCLCLSQEQVFVGGKVIMHTDKLGARMGDFQGHDLPVSALDYNSITRQLASGSRDYTIRIWDGETHKHIVGSKVNWNVVTYLKWQPSTQLLIQCSEDLKLRVWDIREPPMRCAIALDTGDNFATHCDVTDDNKVVTSHRGFNGIGCEAKLWDLRTEQMLTNFMGHRHAVEGAVFLNDKVYTCAKDGRLHRYNMEGGLEEYWEHPSQHPFLHLSRYKEGLLVASSPTTLHYFSPLEPHLTHAMGSL